MIVLGCLRVPNGQVSCIFFFQSTQILQVNRKDPLYRRKKKNKEDLDIYIKKVCVEGEKHLHSRRLESSLVSIRHTTSKVLYVCARARVLCELQICQKREWACPCRTCFSVFLDISTKVSLLIFRRNFLF